MEKYCLNYESENSMNQPKIYLAHPMRGKLGSGGNQEYNYQNVNSAQAIKNVQWLRLVFPQVDFYCPGEVEEPIQMAAKKGLMTTEEVLYMDLCILQENCCGALLHRWEPSEGVNGELNRVRDLGYPWTLIEGPSDITKCSMEDFISIKLLVDEVLEFDKLRRQNV